MSLKEEKVKFVLYTSAIGQTKTQTADSRLQTRGKMQTEGMLQMTQSAFQEN